MSQTIHTGRRIFSKRHTIGAEPDAVDSQVV